MKKLIFSLAFMLIGSFAFANNVEINKDKTNKNEKDSKLVVFENKNKEALDCKDKGGVCLVTIYTNGIPRSFERCCNDIIVVKRPSTITSAD
jgi:hypothetical protein